MNMLDVICEKTNNYIECMPKATRKKYGQFFTSKETARFMASLFDIPKDQKEINILDPGAGTGILSAAIIERIQEYHFDRILLTCYENNGEVMDLLTENLAWISKKSKIPVEIELKIENYITSQESDFNYLMDANSKPVKYDMIISNPPYMKISKNAPEALAMPEICYGAPNTYFLFAAMSLFNLKDNSELVYILPRSWTSGAYFARFREYFLKEGKLIRVHLFGSRNSVFDKEDVLQETMIIKVKKTYKNQRSVLVSSSNTSKDFHNTKFLEVPYDIVVSDYNHYVYLVTNEQEINVMKRLRKFKRTLPEIGLKMKTGLIVDFRNRNALRDKEENGAIPLFYSQHIKDGRVYFPINKEHEYVVAEKKSFAQENRNYLFVKRFTAKEEHRRLQCGIYLAKNLPQYKKISTQNKINFIDGLMCEMSECLVYGLYVLFNSTLYDEYYRVLNGSTQVNATEVNSMPVPEIEIIQGMGRKLMKINNLSEKSCDLILEEYCEKN